MTFYLIKTFDDDSLVFEQEVEADDMATAESIAEQNMNGMKGLEVKGTGRFEVTEQ